MKPDTNWNTKIYISLGIGVGFGIISVLPSFTSCIFPSGIIPSLSEAIKALEITLLTAGLAVVFQVQLDIRREFIDQVEYNPITKALPKISKKITEIPNLSIKNGSIDFAIDSIERMSDEGFVQININKDNYINYLIVLAKSANKSIYGTNIFRPEKIKTFLCDAITGNRIPEYIKTIRESKCSQKIRINILSPADVKGIISDALEALTIKSMNIKILEGEFIPEVVWYLEKVNGWKNKKEPKVKLLWTTHGLAISSVLNTLPKSEISSEEIDDYSIFDGQILSLYDYNEKIDKGVMVLYWASESDENPNSKFQKYLTPFKSIEGVLSNHKIDARKNLYKSFSELVSEMPWENDNSNDNSIDIANMDIEDEVKKYLVSENKPNSLYKIMETHIKNGGKWTFKDDYFKKYFNATIDKLI